MSLACLESYSTVPPILGHLMETTRGPHGTSLSPAPGASQGSIHSLSHSLRCRQGQGTLGQQTLTGHLAFLPTRPSPNSLIGSSQDQRPFSSCSTPPRIFSTLGGFLGAPALVAKEISYHRPADWAQEMGKLPRPPQPQG